jgi:proteasome lid subunit RPN8/RPN11
VRLRLSSGQSAELAALAEAAFPQEACALLLGDGADEILVTAILPARNVAARPEREFELDPAVQVATLRRLRESGAAERIGGPRIVGHWHSHPNGRAEPSEQDAAMIHDRSLLWLISAVTDGRAGPLRAFRPDAAGTGFTPLPLDLQQQDD